MDLQKLLDEQKLVMYILVFVLTVIFCGLLTYVFIDREEPVIETDPPCIQRYENGKM